MSFYFKSRHGTMLSIGVAIALASASGYKTVAGENGWFGDENFRKVPIL